MGGAFKEKLYLIKSLSGGEGATANITEPHHNHTRLLLPQLTAPPCRLLLTSGSTPAECTDLTSSASSLLTNEYTRVTRVLSRHGKFSSHRKFPQASSGHTLCRGSHCFDSCCHGSNQSGPDVEENRIKASTPPGLASCTECDVRTGQSAIHSSSLLSNIPPYGTATVSVSYWQTLRPLPHCVTRSKAAIIVPVEDFVVNTCCLS